jgi:hypothetical protein
MRTAGVIFVGSVAALVIMTAAAPARNSPQKNDERPASSSCHAYQQAPDGSWTERPCEEKGSPVQTEHKPVSRGAEEEPR